MSTSNKIIINAENATAKAQSSLLRRFAFAALSKSPSAAAAREESAKSIAAIPNGRQKTKAQITLGHIGAKPLACAFGA